MDSLEQRPLPHPTHLSQAHWDGARAGMLFVQQCGVCSKYTFPPRPVCTHCFSNALTWVQSSGHGKVYSYTIIHRPPHPAFEPPYCAAIIELEEGWHMLTNLVDVPMAAIEVDMPVSVAFKDFGEITLPMFSPSGDHDG